MKFIHEKSSSYRQRYRLTKEEYLFCHMPKKDIKSSVYRPLGCYNKVQAESQWKYLRHLCYLTRAQRETGLVYKYRVENSGATANYSRMIAEKIERSMPDTTAKYRTEVFVIFGNRPFDIAATSYVSGYTKGRYKWPVKYHAVVVHVPFSGAHMEFVDGVLTVTVKRYTDSAKRVKVVSWKGCNVTLTGEWLYSAGGQHYHADTLHKAKRGCMRKVGIALNKIKDTPPLTPGTVLNMQKYHAITGACFVGMQAWADAHGLSYDVQITAKDLLKLMGTEDTWGRNRLELLLHKGEVMLKKEAKNAGNI